MRRLPHEVFEVIQDKARSKKRAIKHLRAANGFLITVSTPKGAIVNLDLHDLEDEDIDIVLQATVDAINGVLEQSDCKYMFKAVERDYYMEQAEGEIDDITGD